MIPTLMALVSRFKYYLAALLCVVFCLISVSFFNIGAITRLIESTAKEKANVVVQVEGGSYLSLIPRVSITVNQLVFKEPQGLEKLKINKIKITPSIFKIIKSQHEAKIDADVIYDGMPYTVSMHVQPHDNNYKVMHFEGNLSSAVLPHPVNLSVDIHSDNPKELATGYINALQKKITFKASQADGTTQVTFTHDEKTLAIFKLDKTQATLKGEDLGKFLTIFGFVVDFVKNKSFSASFPLDQKGKSKSVTISLNQATGVLSLLDTTDDQETATHLKFETKHPQLWVPIPYEVPLAISCKINKAGSKFMGEALLGGQKFSYAVDNNKGQIQGHIDFYNGGEIIPLNGVLKFGFNNLMLYLYLDKLRLMKTDLDGTITFDFNKAMQIRGKVYSPLLRLDADKLLKSTNGAKQSAILGAGITTQPPANNNQNTRNVRAIMQDTSPIGGDIRSFLDIKLGIQFDKIWTEDGPVKLDFSTVFESKSGYFEAPVSMNSPLLSLNARLKGKQDVNGQFVVTAKGKTFLAKTSVLSDRLSGGVRAEFDVNTTGSTNARLIKNLNGTIVAREGGEIAIQGVSLKDVKEILAQPGSISTLVNLATGSGKTIVKSLFVECDIKNGVGKINLNATSADGTKIDAKGDVNLPAYTMQINGQLDPEIANIKPLKFDVTGPLDAPNYSLDTSDIKKAGIQSIGRVFGLDLGGQSEEKSDKKPANNDSSIEDLGKKAISNVLGSLLG